MERTFLASASSSCPEALAGAALAAAVAGAGLEAGAASVAAGLLVASAGFAGSSAKLAAAKHKQRLKKRVVFTNHSLNGVAVVCHAPSACVNGIGVTRKLLTKDRKTT